MTRPIWDKFGLLRALFPARDSAEALLARRAAGEHAARWVKAATLQPELPADVIRMAGILAIQPMTDGAIDTTDAQRLAYEAGRRDFGLQLLAMMNLTPWQLNSLMENNDA